MTLDVRWSEVNDIEEILQDKHGRFVEITTFAHLMLPMGVQSVTADNAGEVWARLDIMQRIIGSFLYADGKPYLYTPDDVISYIGIKTNCHEISRTVFFKNVVKAHMDEQVRVCTGRTLVT